MSKYKVLISDSFAAEGVEILKNDPSIEVDYDGGIDRDTLLSKIGDAQGLIIRSATTVDQEVLDKADNLKVVVRAGVGVDNIDIPYASKKGVIVMNAPGGNSVSTAEQAIALMFAAARNIAQANEGMHQGKWEKKKLKGTQLTGKTLAVLGLGRIGKEVVKRGKGLQMNVVGYDPYIPKENLSHLEIDIKGLDDILPIADFISVHTPLTDSTRDLLNKDSIGKLKKNAIVINCARGGIYNEADLAEALKEGKLKAAALDVFTKEPIVADHPLIGIPNAILTPHLGASTSEAETAVARETSETVVGFFKEGVARNSLNFPTLDPSEMSYLEPYFRLGEAMGQFSSQLLDGPVSGIQIEFRGKISEYDTTPVETAILKGILYRSMGNEANVVNTPFLSKERGWDISTKKEAEAQNYQNVVVVKLTGSNGSSVIVEGITLGNQPRIVKIGEYKAEIALSEKMLVLKNKDQQGALGFIATFLANQNINIGNLYLARGQGGDAMSLYSLDTAPTDSQIKDLSSSDIILDVKNITLSL